MNDSLPWWRGRRGEWLVVAQAALVVLVLFGPRSWPGWPPWPPLFTVLARILGPVLLLIGVMLSLAGMRALGANLTPLPAPKDKATLVVSGPYRLVRHPIYSGVSGLALGWALWIEGTLTVAYALALFWFFDFKARREERWLLEKFSGYAAYQQRVKRLIPFLY